jgi:hypothetical protein
MSDMVIGAAPVGGVGARVAVEAPCTVTIVRSGAGIGEPALLP